VLAAVVGAPEVDAVVVGATVVDAAVVDAAVGGAAGGEFVGAAVSVGTAKGVRAMTFEGPKGVSTRATDTTRASETAGYATIALSRRRLAGPVLMCFTGNFLG
jgi:hypothetical protein